MNNNYQIKRFTIKRFVQSTRQYYTNHEMNIINLKFPNE